MITDDAMYSICKLVLDYVRTIHFPTYPGLTIGQTQYEESDQEQREV